MLAAFCGVALYARGFLRGRIACDLFLVHRRLTDAGRDVSRPYPFLSSVKNSLRHFESVRTIMKTANVGYLEAVL